MPRDSLPSKRSDTTACNKSPLDPCKSHAARASVRVHVHTLQLLACHTKDALVLHCEILPNETGRTERCGKQTIRFICFCVIVSTSMLRVVFFYYYYLVSQQSSAPRWMQRRRKKSNLVVKETQTKVSTAWRKLISFT